MTVMTKPSKEAPAKKKDLKSILIPVLLVLLGLTVMVYPVVATQWNNAKQDRAAEEYAKLERNADPEELASDLDRAHEYNKTRSAGPILDPWLNEFVPDSDDYHEYLDQLNAFEAMGRLVVPEASVNLPIYHGTEEEVLKKGVGHLYGSDLPVGGEGTHSVMTAHTGLPNATLFDNLKDVKEGDAIYVQVAGEKLKYQVDQIEVVLPHETDLLRPIEGRDLVTLVTCTPYGINSHRLLVRGHRVPMDPSDYDALENAKGAKWQWWMWLLVGAALAVALALLYWVRRQLKKNKATTEDNEDLREESDELNAGANEPGTEDEVVDENSPESRTENDEDD